MLVTATTAAPADLDADTVAVGVFDGKGIAHDVDGVLQALLDGGEAKTRWKHVAHAHARGRRWIVVGLGDRDAFDAERARVAAALAHARAKELGTATLCWELPHRLDDHVAGAFVSGTLLSAYAFTRYKAPDEPPRLQRLVVSDHADRSAAVERARTIAAAQNAARELQDIAANDCTPTFLADHARAIPGVTAEVEGRDGLVQRNMGAFGSVAAASADDPALITLRYTGDAAQPLVGLVGKAVTHDTGGLSIKPAASMAAMKYDMSGGAAVLGAMRAIAALAPAVNVVAVVGATTNTIDAKATKPGDVVVAMDGTTIEVNNTDAEGRLVLADCLLHARELGATKLVDVATLTGGVVSALGKTYAGAFANDDALYADLEGAAQRAGEPVWRLPLHPEYAELMKGRFATLQNAGESKAAHAAQGAEFLHHFAGEVPWAHLDIAGVAWDGGRPYAAKGGTGWGVRLLTELLAG